MVSMQHFFMITFKKPVVILYDIIFISDETQPAEGYAGEPLGTALMHLMPERANERRRI